jgi:hypothetical protein
MVGSFLRRGGLKNIEGSLSPVPESHHRKARADARRFGLASAVQPVENDPSVIPCGIDGL